METSPFPYQGPLLPSQVRGRDELVADLTERLTARRVTALIGPRRFGKTSVLRRVAADIEAVGGTAVVWIDLYEVRSWADLAGRIDDGLAATTGPVRRRLDELAATLELRLGLVRVVLARRDRPDPGPIVHGLLDVVVRIAQTTPLVVMFDEFSSIIGIEGAAGLLRTKFQHHYQTIGLAFAGSEPTTMRALFENRAQPFYAQADLVRVGPLDAAALDAIVAAGFGGDPPPGLAAAVQTLTGGHPYRAMQLADAAWRIVQTDPGLDPDLVWPSALATVRGATDVAHETYFSALPHPDRAVLRILASGGSIYGAAARRLELANGSAQSSRARLEATGAVTSGPRPDLTDPLLADWLRRRLPV